jgi:hypothetical protein
VHSSHAAGDSYTNGWANLGNLTCPVLAEGVPYPEFQDATLSWGALAANHFTADYQLLAWSGAGMSTYSNLAGSDVDPAQYALVEPEIPDLFDQVVAGLNTTLVSDFTAWVPQASLHLSFENGLPRSSSAMSESTWAFATSRSILPLSSWWSRSKHLWQCSAFYGALQPLLLPKHSTILFCWTTGLEAHLLVCEKWYQSGI